MVSTSEEAVRRAERRLQDGREDPARDARSDDAKKTLAGFQKVAAGLDKVRVWSKKSSRTVAALDSAIKASAQVLAVATAAQDKMEKLDNAQDALDKKEDALVDKVNAYCSK